MSNDRTLDNQHIVLTYFQQGLDDYTLDFEHTRKALRESLDFFAQLIDTMPDIVILVDNTLNIVFINACAYDILGYRKEELIGKHLFKLVDLEEQERLIHDIEELKGKKLGLGLFHGVAKDGTKIPFEINGDIIYLKDGAPAGIVCICRDIRDRLLAEKEREHLISRLQDALDNVRKLSGLLPICASCKKIRDDAGYWTQIESYIRDHSEAEFSHSICPECLRTHYPEFADKIRKT